MNQYRDNPILDPETREDFRRMEPISSFFPLAYPKGRWTRFNGECSRCGRSLRLAELRGSVVRVHSAWLVKGFGLCDRCDALTRFVCFLNDEPTLTVVDAEGSSLTYAPTKPSALRRLLGRLLSLFRAPS